MSDTWSDVDETVLDALAKDLFDGIDQSECNISMQKTLPENEEVETNATPSIVSAKEPNASNESSRNFPNAHQLLIQDSQEDMLSPVVYAPTRSSAVTVTPASVTTQIISKPRKEKLITFPPTNFADETKLGQKHDIDADVVPEPAPNLKRLKMSIKLVTKHDSLLGHNWASEGKRQWRKVCEPYQRNDSIVSDDVVESLVKKFENEEITGLDRTRKVLELVDMEQSQLPQQVQLYKHNGRFYKLASIKAVRDDISKNYKKKAHQGKKSVCGVIAEHKEKLSALRNSQSNRLFTSKPEGFEDEAAEFEETLKDLENGSFCKAGCNLKVQSAREKHAIAMIKSMWKAIIAKPPPDGNSKSIKNHSRGSDSHRDRDNGEDDADDRDEGPDNNDGLDSGPPTTKRTTPRSSGDVPGASLQCDTESLCKASIDWEDDDKSSGDEEAGDSDEDDNDYGGSVGSCNRPRLSNRLGTLVKYHFAKTIVPPSSSREYAAVQSTKVADKSPHLSDRKSVALSNPSNANSSKRLHRVVSHSPTKHVTEVPAAGTCSALVDYTEEDRRVESADNECDHPVHSQTSRREMMNGCTEGVRRGVDLLIEQIQVMLKRETGAYKIHDFLSPGFQNAITPTNYPELCRAFDALSSTERELWRRKMCEWSYEVVDHFGLKREVVSVSMNFLDRFLATQAVDKDQFQLVAMTTLALAVKVCGCESRLTMAGISELSRSKFTVHQLASMEMLIARTISWYMHPPTARCFAEYIISLLPDTWVKPFIRNDVCEYAGYLIELSVLESFFVAHRPSEVALAALQIAMEELCLDSEAIAEFKGEVKSSINLDATSGRVTKCRGRLQRLQNKDPAFKRDQLHDADVNASQGSPQCVRAINEQ